MATDDDDFAQENTPKTRVKRSTRNVATPLKVVNDASEEMGSSPVVRKTARTTARRVNSRVEMDEDSD